MTIKLNSIQEALKFRGRNTADGYIDCDGLNHGEIYGRGCISGCLFQSGYALDPQKWGCYLLAEKGLSKREIFTTKREMEENKVVCEWYCDNNSRTIVELGVRQEINRIAKSRGFYEEYHVSIPEKTGTKDGCFIATAVYGDYEHPKVLVLREFRDQKLKTNIFGMAFVKTYYKISPYLSSYIGSRPSLTAKIRTTLDFIVAQLVRRNNGTYRRR